MKAKKEKFKMPLKGEVKIELRDKDGKLKETRKVKNTFMAAGDAHVADQLSDQAEAQMGWMSVGTSPDAKTTADTALNSEIDRNALAAGYPELGSGGADNDVKYKATLSAGDGSGDLTEAAIFNSSGAGTMLCGSTFSVINKGASDTLTITWTVTCGAS